MSSEPLRSKLDYLREHRFIKSVATLQFASIVGNFIQALIGVFLARLLQPENFGVYAIAFGLSSLVFISTGVQETVLLALGETYTKQDQAGTKDALAFFAKFTGFFILITLAITAFLPLIGRVFYHNALVGFYAAIIVVSACVSSTAFAMVTMLLQVTGKIRHMAGLILTDQTLRFSLSLVFILLGFGLTGAMLGHLVGAIIIAFLSLFVWSRLSKNFPIFPSFGKLFHTRLDKNFKKHFHFSLWATLDKNIASLYAILPVLLVGIYVTTTQVTFFKLAFGFVSLALSLLGPISVLLNFEFPKMQIENSANLRHNFIKVSLYSLGLSALLTLGAVITAPLVFRYLYGLNFVPGVKYVFGLFVYGTLFGIGVGLGPMWRAVNRVRTSIVINIIVLGLGIPLGLWLIRSYGLWGGVIMVTLWHTISHFASFIILSKILKQP